MRRSHRSVVALLSASLLLAACGGPGSTGSNGEPGPTGADGSPSGSGEQEFADTIVTALDAQVGNMSNAVTDVPTGRITALIYDYLYTINDKLEAVPQLASDFCEVSADGLTWTCTLVDGALFHNGDPITVDDVVFTYQLALSPNCTFNPANCIEPFVESVEAVDDSTIRFQLLAPYAPFATSILPAIGIESRAVIEESYAGYAGSTEGLEAAAVQAAVDELTATSSAENADPAACDAAAAAATEILDGAGIAHGSVDDFVMEDDPETADVDETDDGRCAFADSLIAPLTSVAGSLATEGIDSIAAAYQLLDFNREPVGSGPYMVESVSTEGVVLTAFEDYWQGTPVTRTIEMPIFTDVAVAANALAAGEVDWVTTLTPDARAAVAGAIDDGRVKLAEYNQFGHYELQYNMHESTTLADGSEWQGWFYDINLRQAMQVCIDKANLVEIATDGNGVAIEADVPPASWAFNPDVVTVPRDVDAGKALIESATVHTWTMGDDGIYVNEDGDRLSAHVLVRAGQQDRIDFMDLLAEEVLDCGIELDVEAADFQTVLTPSLSYPHIPPGQDEPWAAYFGGWGVGVDPDPYALFHSSQCTSEEQPGTYNYVCLQDGRIDELIEAGIATSDQEERTEIYFEYQERMQELQPYLFGWSNINADGLSAGMQYSDGPLELDSPFWGWQAHKLAKVVSAD